MASKEELIRSSSDQLAGIMARGLRRLRADDLTPALEGLRGLGLDGLADEIEGLPLVKDVNRRFKTLTRALYALTQSEFALASLKRASLDDAPRLEGREWIRLAPETGPPSEDELRRLVTAPHGGIELAHAVERIDLARLPVARILPLLAHDEVRGRMIERIARLDDDRRLVLGSQCIEARNRMIREAGVVILGQTPGEEAAATLLAKLVDRKLAPVIARHVETHRDTYVRRLVELLSSEKIRLRREAAHLLHRCAGPDWGDEIRVLASKEADATTRAWLELACPPRQEGGGVDLRWLKSAAGRTDEHVMRIFAKAALIRENAIGTKYLMAEFNSADPIVFKLTMEAITRLDFPERVLDSLFQDLHKAPKATTRRDALRRLLFLDHELLVPHLLEACRDGNGEVSRMATEALVDRRGMAALERLFDLEPVYGDHDALPAEVRQQVNTRLLPLLVRVGDARFAPYLAGLFADRVRSGDRYEWRKQLLPELQAYGEPLVEELGDLLHHEDGGVSLAAEELLLELGTARGAMLLEAFHADRDTVEVALRRLESPDLLEASTRSLTDEMDDPDVVDRLLEMFDRPETRDQVLKLFQRLRPPEALPRLAGQLGGRDGNEQEGGRRDLAFLDGPLSDCLLAYDAAAVATLSDALDGESWSRRCHAAHLLGRIGQADGGPALVRRLADEQEPEVLVELVRAIGAIGHAPGLPAVSRLVKAPRKEVRQAVYESLADLGNAAALNVLQEALGDCKDLSERRKVQSALNELKKRIG